MLHTLKLLQGGFKMLIMSHQVESGGTVGDTSIDSQVEPIGPEAKLESQRLDSEKQDVQEKVSQQINMELINNVGTLRMGSKGEAVKALQKFLNTYYGFNLTVDGSFGDGTLGAVKVLQYNNKLSSDGVVGKNTKEAMTNIVIAQTTIREPIQKNSPTNIFKEQTVSASEVKEQLDTTHNKLDALNLMINRGSEVSEAIESYMNGGQRDEIISDKGGIWGLIRQVIGKNNFDNYLAGLDDIKANGLANINAGIDTLLQGSNKKNPSVSPQTKKDISLMLGSLLLSSFNSISIPVFHLRNKLGRSLVNSGVDLKQANNFGAYVEQTQGSEKFDVNKAYVSDHGVDALEFTNQLQHTLRSFGLSQEEIDTALAGEVSETATKIRTVVESFLQNILGRDLDAITKGSFGMVEKSVYIPFGGKGEAIPGNNDVTIPARSFIGDAKYGAAKKIVKKIYAEIDAIGTKPLSEIMGIIQTRMQGITYLVNIQADEYDKQDKNIRAKTIRTHVSGLDQKVDYIDTLGSKSSFFERYSVLSEDRELLRAYSVINTVGSFEQLLYMYSPNEYVSNKILSMVEIHENQEFLVNVDTVLSDPQVKQYLNAVSNGEFGEYTRSQIKPEQGLNKITVGSDGKHGLPVDRDNTGAEVFAEMKNNTVDGKFSVLSSIRNTLIDYDVVLSEHDIEYAMLSNWEAVDIDELSGVVINSAREGGTQNDQITTFADLAKKRGDTFMFKTSLEKTIQYLDADGNSHMDTYKYTLYFRPECKNPVLHSELLERDGQKVDRQKAPDFNTAVPGLLTSTIPVWINVDLKGNDPKPEPDQTQDNTDQPDGSNNPEHPNNPDPEGPGPENPNPDQPDVVDSLPGEETNPGGNPGTPQPEPEPPVVDPTPVPDTEIPGVDRPVR